MDARADLYALGVVAYEMLVRSPPFTGATAQQVVTPHFTEVPRLLYASNADVTDLQVAGAHLASFRRSSCSCCCNATSCKVVPRRA